MKKSILLTLLSISCFGFASLAWACNDETSSSESTTNQTHTVTFTDGKGFTYEKSASGKTLKVENGEEISFSLDIGAFYTGTPIVLADGVALPSLDGTYNLTVTKDTTITVEGITKDVSSMVGTGAYDDAFVISRPIDLIYIAEQVNAGNETYATAAYVLGNDIDCKGETLQVIGDMRTENAFFSGCFSCYTDSETNEATRYTISNFKINATNSSYVGLFGCVQADLTTEGSGLFYGIRIDDFEITASVKNMKNEPVMYCGGLIGYGMGVTAYLCDATNGKINVLADDNYFSFAGGLMGCQQGSYQQNYGQIFSSEIAYSTVDVDVTAVQGSVLYAGGVVGYAFTDSLVAPSFIHNAYSTGNVSGAARSGGIAGGLGQYTSVSNAYTTGDIFANCVQAKDLVSDEEYCYAFSGGIVGFAENDTSINDCFSAGSVTARASEGASYQKANAAVGGGYEAGYTSVDSQKYAVDNCVGGVTKTTATESAKTTLGWRAHDWNFAENAFPTINYEPSDTTVATVVTVKYITKDTGVSVKVNNLTQTTLTYEDSYAPLVDAFNSGELGIYLSADDPNYRSFGYFFDEACTRPVPYSYLTTSDKTLYVGFANYAPVVGDYELVTEGGVYKLELTADGYAVYQDGTIEQQARYQFDGETLLLEGVKFAKYYLGEINPDLSVNEDKAFDMNRYQYYNFNANFKNGSLELYDGVYFTASKPLIAYKQKATGVLVGDYYVKDGGDITYYTFRADGTCTGVFNDNPTLYTYTLSDTDITLTVGISTETISKSDLQAYDCFKGTWSKSISVGKTYEFDGIGSWSSYYGATLFGKGTYTISDDKMQLTLSSGEKVTFDTEGFLKVEKDGAVQRFYKQNSFVGTWTAADKTLSLTLGGINEAGFGNATIAYTDGYSYELLYETSENASYVCLYQLQNSGELTYKVIYGYFTYDEPNHTLSITAFNPYDTNTGYTSHSLQIVDEYVGEWISENELFALIEFNGAGNYYDEFLKGGALKIGNETVEYTLDNQTLNGTFTYHGVEYTLTFDEDNQTVNISAGGAETILWRKDVFAGQAFIGFDEKTFTVGSSYRFDGASNLEKGGKLTVGNATYVYKKTAENVYTVYAENAEIGYIVKAQDGSHYELTLGEEKTALYLENELMGDWAMSGAFDTLKIGPTDLNGKIFVRYENKTARMEYADPSMLTFSCEIENMPRTFYVFPLGTAAKVNGIALSEYSSLVYRDYVLCSKADELYGTWSQTSGGFSMQFDGVSFDADNRYAYGTATLIYKGKATAYYYMKNANGNIVMWSQELLLGYTVYYTLTECEITQQGAYVNADGTKAFLRVEVDALFGVVAKDASGVKYAFDGGNVGGNEGTITAGEKTYSYKITAYDSVEYKATLILTDKESGEIYDATLDYSNPDDQKITLVKQTTNEQT